MLPVCGSNLAFDVDDNAVFLSVPDYNVYATLNYMRGQVPILYAVTLYSFDLYP